MERWNEDGTLPQIFPTKVLTKGLSSSAILSEENPMFIRKSTRNIKSSSLRNSLIRRQELRLFCL